ncbi:helix-turn-helix domain-containing protein [Muricoccus radiodurans]|uniref:helix-turn-helix domain-containing protein n=1 Tax=Muricoccus radiodurans TaxID=2231721 RepID=UPI003CF8E366
MLENAVVSTDRSVREPRSSPIDVHVGTRVRLRRTLLGWTQERLGDALGITFQQVQKYERGVNRIGASRLFDLARVLDVPIGFFFDAMPDDREGARETAEQQDSVDSDALHRRETLELVRAYYRISDPAIRKRVMELTKSLGLSDD